MTKVIVTQKPDADEVPTEVLAQSIVAVSDGIKKLRAGRLNDRALILLIQHSATYKLPQVQVKSVLDAIEGLAATYLKKPAPAQR